MQCSEIFLNFVPTLIYSNKKGAGILDRAASHKIPCKYVAVKGRSKEAYDDEVSACLKKSGAQLILMVRTTKLLEVSRSYFLLLSVMKDLNNFYFVNMFFFIRLDICE